MADRVVAVGLTANTASYVAGMNKASQAAQRTARETEKIGSSVDKTTKSMKTFKNIALYAVGYGVAAGVGQAIRSIVSSMAEFDAAMASAASASMATRSELDAMRETALKAGQDTQFTGTQAAGAITELAKAGVSTADILGGALAGALDLAAAGEVDVAFAAETAATAMVQFGIAGRDMDHVADLLAAGAGKAQGGVEELALALRQGGQVASMVGWSFEDTTTALTAFAASGLLGSDAGTSLKTMLLRLANPANKAREVMEEYGLSVYDSNGNMIGASELAGRLTQAFGHLEPEARNAAMGIIFGTDAVRAANVMYANGESGIAEWSRQVDDSGYAAEQAARKTDTLQGDINRLRGTVEAIASDEGSDFLEMLRLIVQWSDMGAKAIAGLTGALNDSLLGGLGGPMGFLATQIADLPTKIENVGLAWEQAMTPEGFKLWGSGTGDRLTSGFSLQAQIEEQRELVLAGNAAREADEMGIMSRKRLGEVSIEAAQGIDVAGDSTDDLADAAEAAQDEIDALKDAILGLGQTYSDIEGAQDAVTRAVRDARQPLRELEEAKKAVAEASTDEERAAAQAALAQAESAITLKGNSDAALDNRENMRAMADEIKRASAELVDLDETGQMSRAEMEKGRKQFIRVARQLGYTKQEAEAYADQLGLIPGDVPTRIKLYGAGGAIAEAARVQAALLGIKDRYVSVFVSEVRRDSAAESRGTNPGGIQGARPKKRAKGGWVRGPGTATSDSIPAVLSNGEYVLSARMASVFGPFMEAIRTGKSVNNSRTLNANTVNLMTPDPSREWDFMQDLAAV